MNITCFHFSVWGSLKGLRTINTENHCDSCKCSPSMFHFLLYFFSLFQLSFNLPFSDLCAAYALGLRGTQSRWTVLCLIRILSLHNNISIAPLMQPVLVPLGSNSLLAALLMFPAFAAHLYCCFCFGNMTSSNFILTMSNYQIKLQHCSRQENERLDSDIFMIYILPVFQF